MPAVSSSSPATRAMGRADVFAIDGFHHCFFHGSPKEAHIRLGKERKYMYFQRLFGMCVRAPEAAVNTSVVFMHIFFLHVDPCQHYSTPLPFRSHTKSYFFLSQLLTEAYSTTESKRGKAHAGCLSPREDCIFYLSPLGFIFTVNSWLKCNQPRNPPYVHSCHSSSLANRIKCKQMGKKKKNSALPTKLKKPYFWFCQS